MEGYGKKLRELRGEKTIETVADAVNVSRSAIGMYEAEERIPRDDIKVRLAAYFGVTVQELFFAHQCHELRQSKGRNSYAKGKTTCQN